MQKYRYKKPGIKNGLDANFYPRVDFPHVDSPDAVFPCMVFASQLNTNISNTKTSNTKTSNTKSCLSVRKDDRWTNKLK